MIKSGKQIKAILYEIEIYDNVVSMAHGFGRKIKELYIPKYRVTVNLEEENFHCFRSEKDRYEHGIQKEYIKIPEQIAINISFHISDKSYKEKIFKNWFKKVILTSCSSNKKSVI